MLVEVSTATPVTLYGKSPITLFDLPSITSLPEIVKFVTGLTAKYCELGEFVFMEATTVLVIPLMTLILVYRSAPRKSYSSSY